MEAVKDWIECINFHWIAMIAAGMYTHVRQICVIGLCFEDGPIVHPSYSSLLFIFSILSVFAEYKPWPRSLKEPPAILLYIYEMLVAALVANLSTRAIWTPLVHVIWALTLESSKWLMCINSLMGLDRYSVIVGLANFMATDEAASYMTSCLSILSFVWMMDATESLDAMLDYFSRIKIYYLWLAGRRLRVRRISFQDPEVTDWFFYTSPTDTSKSSSST